MPRVVPLLALALLTLAGCVAPSPAPAAEDGAADAPGYVPNLYLLDGPRPPSARVSGGAEPSMLAASDGKLYIGDTSGVWRSTNGGASWQLVRVPAVIVADGWSLAEDAAGTIYAATTGGVNIAFGASKDDGATWSTSLLKPHQYAVDVWPGVADRPWVAARGDGEVAIIHFAYPRSEACLRSIDGGETWPDRRSAKSEPTAGNLVFDDAGDMYYVNTDTGILHRLNKGCLLTTPLTAAVQVGSVDMFPDPVSASNGFIQVAAEGGRFYAAAANQDNSQIVLSGLDGYRAAGRKLLVVSDPALRSNTYPTVSARGDEVAVAWYASETAGDPNSASFDGAWNVYVARVRDFWTATPQVTVTRITTEPNHVGEICMDGVGCDLSGEKDRDLLDYFGIDHGPDGTLHVAYGHDGSGSRAEVRHAKLAP